MIILRYSANLILNICAATLRNTQQRLAREVEAENNKEKEREKKKEEMRMEIKMTEYSDLFL